MPGVCSTSSRDELMRWLMPVAPQEGFRSRWESRSRTRTMSIVGVLLPHIIFDTWWFQPDVSQQFQMKECIRPLCCRWPLPCKMMTFVWRWWLITNYKHSHCQIPPHHSSTVSPYVRTCISFEISLVLMGEVSSLCRLVRSWCLANR